MLNFGVKVVYPLKQGLKHWYKDNAEECTQR